MLRIDFEQVWPDLIMGTLLLLFPLWSMYLLLCFAIHQLRAARIARNNWRAADASQSAGEISKF